MLLNQTPNTIGSGVRRLRPVDPPALHFDHNHGVRFVARQSLKRFVFTVLFRQSYAAVRDKDVARVIVSGTVIRWATEVTGQTRARQKRRAIVFTIPTLALINSFVNMLFIEIRQEQHASA
jgi:hypothetical protein